MSKQFDFGPIAGVMNDSAVSEVMINGPKKVFVEKQGKKILSDVKFASEDELEQFVQRLLAFTGKRLEKEIPYIDATLADGSRINVIAPPVVARSGIAVTIRKFSKDIRTLKDIVENGTMPQNVADFLIAAIKGKLNMIFSGGTSTGKTTAIQLLSTDFPAEERIVVVEDTPELHVDHENIIYLETRRPDIDGRGEVTIRDLVRNTLRMSPDRIVLGEVRGSEVVDMIQAMATGHDGCLMVMHGNSPQEVISRLETMILLAGFNLPHNEIRKMIGTTIELIVHFAKLPGGLRRITHITELRGFERGEILFNPLFNYQNVSVDVDGKPVAQLKSCLREYPLFYRNFLDRGLLQKDVFKTEFIPTIS